MDIETIEKLEIEPSYIILSRYGLENCLGYVEGAGHGQIWD